ncbi:HlyD family type I secretion membrane fusion protein [Sphingomonas sp. PAMC 26617]|uniref:HlyD family type I secretion membrane fusion protein n=1 Tax=Sphingomonas sp. PAMC 26617 TaxID=1112216 RepID=UPI000289F9AD|nr:HlyD family type I secretion membrane fusion protein [Sphingomonas sp. PAMC 26617]
MSLSAPVQPRFASEAAVVVDLHGGRLEHLTKRVRPATASNLLLWVILGLFAVALLWAWLTVLDRTVRATGRVIPGAQLQVVSNLEGGIVSAILVRVGQPVRAGTPMITLDRTEAGAALGAGAATMAALSAKIARLEGEVKGVEPRFDPKPDAVAMEPIAIERSLHRSRIAALASVMGESSARIMQADRAAAEARATYASRKSAARAADRELVIIRPLVEQGIEPRMSLIQQENQASMAASDVAAASASVARTTASIAEARAAAAQMREDWRGKAADELAAARSEFAARRQPCRPLPPSWTALSCARHWTAG